MDKQPEPKQLSPRHILTRSHGKSLVADHGSAAAVMQGRRSLLATPDGVYEMHLIHGKLVGYHTKNNTVILRTDLSPVLGDVTK